MIGDGECKVQAVNYKSVVHSVLSFERIVPHLFFNLLHMLHASSPARRSLTAAVSYARNLNTVSWSGFTHIRVCWLRQRNNGFLCLIWQAHRSVEWGRRGHHLLWLNSDNCTCAASRSDWTTKPLSKISRARFTSASALFTASSLTSNRACASNRP